MTMVADAEHLLKRITVDPHICHGKPVIRGLRHPVEVILELLSSGMTFDEILTDYEDLERDDIYAALAYAVRLTNVKRMCVLKEQEVFQTMLASEAVLRREWDTPEEEAAWAHL